MPADTDYTIADLARLTGVNVRTIRYYLAQGLLPATGESGPGAHYSQGHLDRLKLTKRLQEQHLPLAEIRVRLGEMRDEDVAALVGEAAAPQAPPTSALDYVRSVLAASSGSAGTAARGAAPRLARSMSPASAPSGASAPIQPPHHLAVGSISQLSDAALRSEALPAPALEEATTHHEPPPLERSQWERLSLGPNVELHVRRPLSRQEQKRVERLITIARQVLKEGQP